MNHFTLKFSPKSIPLPSREAFLKKLLFQSEKFLKRLRWKAHFFDNPDASLEEKENFGFHTHNCPPNVKDLQPFEADFYTMLSKIEFERNTNETLKEIGEVAQKIRKSSSAIVPADKSSNFYELDVELYSKLISKSITSDYKITNEHTKSIIDMESAKICRNLEIDDRVEEYQSSTAYILLKDHKPNFRSKADCRLINPAKTDVGQISKRILEKIVAGVKISVGANQWRNTNEVLTWFRRERTEKCCFIQFDVVSFYPSISEELFAKALDFAQNLTIIKEEERNILQHARNSLLFSHDGETWQKKNGLFDVTMGSYDGAETCELVGLFLLSKVIQFIPKNQIGLYRDDGLMLIKNPNGPYLDRLRKRLHQTFQEEGLKITVENPSHVVDFLDVTLNCADASYRPFRKENSTTEYVNKNSNHPPHIIKRIPEIIENRLNNISSDASIFDDSKKFYEDCLRNGGYKNVELSYSDTPKLAHKPKRNRSRNIMWFNPPWSANVATNIGKRFFQLLEKHFPAGHRYRKFINRNSVKLSYSCMDNLRTIINKKNKSLLQKHSKPEEPEDKTCNCRSGVDSCPLEGNCLTKSLVYKATLKTDGETYSYIGLTAETFKKRYSNHLCSFRNEKYRDSTTLSQKIWELKESARQYELSWEVVRRATAYKSGGGGKCDLCLSEKLEILKRMKDKGCLNNRNELLSKCRHLRGSRLKRILPGTTCL